MLKTILIWLFLKYLRKKVKLLKYVIKHENLLDCGNLWIIIPIHVNFFLNFYKKRGPANEIIDYFSLNIFVYSFFFSSSHSFIL